VRFSPDGSQILTGVGDGKARLWDAFTGELVLELAGHPEWAISVGYSSDGSQVIAGGDDGSAWVWDATTGKQMLILTGHDG
jgi:WD40 repeat protein